MKAQGYHFFLDAIGVDFEVLDDENYLKEVIERGCENCDLDLKKIWTYKFKPQGVSVVAVIGESHISLHTYPEDRSFMLDIFHCGRDGSKALLFIEYIIKVFEPTISNMRKIFRGSGRLHVDNFKMLYSSTKTDTSECKG